MITLYACVALVTAHALLPGSDLQRLGAAPAAAHLAGMAGPGRPDSRDLRAARLACAQRGSTPRVLRSRGDVRRPQPPVRRHLDGRRRWRQQPGGDRRERRNHAGLISRSCSIRLAPAPGALRQLRRPTQPPSRSTRRRVRHPVMASHTQRLQPGRPRDSDRRGHVPTHDLPPHRSGDPNPERPGAQGLHTRLKRRRRLRATLGRSLGGGHCSLHGGGDHPADAEPEIATGLG
jgi:hypothetical protein